MHSISSKWRKPTGRPSKRKRVSSENAKLRLNILEHDLSTKFDMVIRQNLN